MYTTIQWDNRDDREQRRRVIWAMTLPLLRDCGGADAVCAFIERLASAFREWIAADLVKELDGRYAKADRAGRMAFPADVRLHCLCRETDVLFSTHFTATVSLGEDTRSACVSFVWDKSDGRLMRLSDLTPPGFAASHRGWAFYLAADGLRVYRADRSGKITKREKVPDIKSGISS